MKTFLILVLCWLGLCYSAQAAVNINTANQTELESLPGIGPVKAKAILEYRKKNGGFKSLDELTRVDGIGPVTLKNARNDIVLDASATSKPTALSANPKSHVDSMKTLKQAAPAATVLKTPIQPTGLQYKTQLNQALVTTSGDQETLSLIGDWVLLYPHTQLRAGIRAKNERAAALVTGRQHHAFAKAKLHFTWRQIGHHQSQSAY